MAIYNNPALGAGFESLASAFGPPPAGDLVNYAQAAGLRQKNDIIAKLRSDPRYAGADAGVLADLFDPTNSWAAQDQNDATKRYDIDTTAATLRANNLQDNQFGLFGTVAQDALRPAVPANVAGMFGLDGPLPAVQGNRSPLSETQVEGQELLRLIGEGDITDQMQVDNYRGGNAPVKIVGPGGKPTFQTPGGAIGQEAYVDAGSQPKPENAVAVLPDGKTQVPAIQGPDGRWYNAQTKAPLPDDIRIFKIPQAQGSASDVGLSKPTGTYIEKQLIQMGTAKRTALTLRDKIATSPASQGAVGWIRGTVQNLVQTGDELSQFFGGTVAEVNEQIKAGLLDPEMAQFFDPNIPAIEGLANALAFQYGQTLSGDRFSNEMLRAARSALGLDGFDANQANSLARIDAAIAQIDSQMQMLNSVRNEGIEATMTPAPGAPAAQTGGVPAGWSADEWGVLTDEEKQMVLNDQ